MDRTEVNEKLKLAFVHIPKTAGMSIGKALGVEGHHPCSYYRSKHKGCIVFCVMRGHIERLVSSHNYHERNKDTIKFFKNSLSLQSKPLDYWLDRPCDYYLRFEKLQEDFDSMMDDLGHDRIKLERVNENTL